jgi:hypothetical protein
MPEGVNELARRQILAASEQALRKAGVYGVVPTPLDAVGQANGVEAVIDISQMPDDLVPKRSRVQRRSRCQRRGFCGERGPDFGREHRGHRLPESSLATRREHNPYQHRRHQPRPERIHPDLRLLPAWRRSLRDDGRERALPHSRQRIHHHDRAEHFRQLQRPDLVRPGRWGPLSHLRLPLLRRRRQRRPGRHWNDPPQRPRTADGDHRPGLAYARSHGQCARSSQPGRGGDDLLLPVRPHRPLRIAHVHPDRRYGLLRPPAVSLAARPQAAEHLPLPDRRHQPLRHHARPRPHPAHRPLKPNSLR